jgi:hypothetical protein
LKFGFPQLYWGHKEGNTTVIATTMDLNKNKNCSTTKIL